MWHHVLNLDNNFKKIFFWVWWERGVEYTFHKDDWIPRKMRIPKPNRGDGNVLSMAEFVLEVEEASQLSSICFCNDAIKFRW